MDFKNSLQKSEKAIVSWVFNFNLLFIILIKQAKSFENIKFAGSSLKDFKNGDFLAELLEELFS